MSLRCLAEHSDEQFRKDQVAEYCLALKVSESSLGYAVRDSLRNKVVHLAEWGLGSVRNTGHLANVLKDFLQERPWLQGGFMSVQLLAQGSPYTLVPSQLIDGSDAAAYLEAVEGHPQNPVFLSTDIFGTEARAVFGLRPGLPESVCQAFPTARVTCYDTELCKALGMRESEGDMMSAYLNVESPGRFQVLIFKGQRLQFLNTFSYQGVQDFLYHLMASLTANGLNPGIVSLKVCGAIDRSYALFDAIYKYVRNVSLIGRNSALNYSPFFDGIPSHRYYNLISALV